MLLPAPGAPVMPISSALARCAGTNRVSKSSASGPRFSMRVAARAKRAKIAAANTFARGRSSGLEQLPGDHQALDFARAFADRAELHVAIEFLNRIVLDEAVAAVDLQGVVADPHSAISEANSLAMDDSLVTRSPAILHVRRAIGQQARGIDRGGHVRQLVLNRLEFGDRPPELPALLGIAECGIVGALRRADRQRGDGNAPAIQDAQAIDEALAFTCPAIGNRGTRQSVKITSPVSLARMPELVLLLSDAETRRAFFDDERRNAVLRAVRSVTAMATQTWAKCALVVNVLAPLITQPSPSCTAMVRVPAASDPASGSVSDQQPIHSPVASFGIYLRRCSSLPAV